MARASLFSLLVAPAITACLDTPPEYQAAIPVPPVIETSLVTPSTTAPVIVTGDTIDFTVPFRSDDEGEALVAYFVWDLPTGGDGLDNIINNSVSVVDADPRPFAEQTNREVTFHWPWSSELKPGPGCHSVTMILSHNSNFQIGHGYLLVDALAAAQVTWFLGLGATGTTCGISGQGGTQ
ncbi:MAG TPA: hypothetical protein VHE30_14060 [Polyangiaceae bacterium]|nr:hypothetical protein [Polyangiaceae bacterium]